MKQRGKKRPDNNEIAMRNLAVENASAMGQGETLISRGETHPGKTQMTGQGNTDDDAADK